MAQTSAVEFAGFGAQRRRPAAIGSGLGRGLKLSVPDVAPKGSRDLEDSLDIFHTFREARRALRRACTASRAWSEPRRPRRSSTSSAVREIADRPRHIDEPPVASGRGLWVRRCAAEGPES